MSASVTSNPSPGSGLPIRNFSLSLFSKVVSLGAHLAFVMVTARLFPKEEVAAIAVAGIVTILMDVCKGVGLGTVLLKRLPQLDETDERESQTLLATYLVYSLLPPLALTLLGLAAPGRFVTATFGVAGHETAFRVGLVASLFTVLSNTNILVLQASRQFGRLAALTLITAALQRLAPCVAAIWFGARLDVFLIWWAAAAALGFLATCFPLVGLMRPWQFRILAWSAFWPESRHFFATSLLRYGATQIDQLFVAILFPPATLAVYYMLRRLYSLGLVLVGSMIDALVPELAQQAGTDAVAARGRLREWSRLSLFAGSAGAAIMAGNGSAVIEILLGPGYGDDALLIALFAGTTSLYFLYCFVQVDLMLFQAPEKIFWMAAATAAANLVVGPLVAHWLGVHSIPLAMLGGHFLGLVAARWKGGTKGPARRPVWRIRELGVSLLVVMLASLAPVVAHRAPLEHWERAVLVNVAICCLLTVHFWRNDVGESLRRLGQPAV
jgi:O-antigen/teichoic acid export membrane protein